MDLSPSTVEFQPVDEKGWLGSKHGTDATRTITLDLANGGFADVTVTETGTGRAYIKSGTPVYELASGLYARAAGAEVADGHLFESVMVKAGSAAAGAALLWHGVVIAAQVPGGFADANRAADHILYI